MLKRVKREFVYVSEGEVVREAVTVSEQLADMLDTVLRDKAILYTHGTDTAVAIRDVRADDDNCYASR